MELKTTKVYVPTHEILKDGWVNLGQDKREFVKIKEGYLLTKEELEKVITDAWLVGGNNAEGITKTNLEQYLNSILK